MDQLFNSLQSDNKAEEFAPVFLRLQKDVKIVHPNCNWVVDGVDFTTRFIAYQERCIDIANKSGFILETHAHEVLMLSSILLVKPQQHSDFMLKHFKSEELDLLRKHVLNDICADIEFDENATIKITRIIKVSQLAKKEKKALVIILHYHMKDLNKNKIGREETVTKLIQLRSELTPNECRLLNSLVNL